MYTVTGVGEKILRVTADGAVMAVNHRQQAAVDDILLFVRPDCVVLEKYVYGTGWVVLGIFRRPGDSDWEKGLESRHTDKQIHAAREQLKFWWLVHRLAEDITEPVSLLYAKIFNDYPPAKPAELDETRLEFYRYLVRTGRIHD